MFGKPRSDSVVRFVLPPGPAHGHAGYAAQKERMTAALSQLVDQAKAQGELRPELPTPLVVVLLTGIIREASYDDMIDPETFPPCELGGMLVSMLLDGIRVEQRVEGRRSVNAFG